MELYVPILVIIELIWVFESVYKFERTEILQTLSDLTLMPIFKFENLSVIQACIQDAQSTKFDLSDLLIAHSAEKFGIQSVLTFDNKVAKHKLFQWVEA